MFFKTKRTRRKTTRQTLSTEQLEPKAMFSVSPVEPVVALDVGPVNQASVEDCMVIEPLSQFSTLVKTVAALFTRSTTLAKMVAW